MGRHVEADLEPRLVGDITGSFYVPAYQRGYRWGPAEVDRLLDDIWENRDQPYYLQPIVVKQYGEEWELVDGQQRLTTLYLIFEYIRKEAVGSIEPTYSIRYETRPESAAYLKDLDPSRRDENIDFFHIDTAYQCIRTWFEAHGPRRQFAAMEMYGALFKSVRVIWYEAEPDVDGIALFTRLNVGRIPLTDAELVKALLLSRLRHLADYTDRSIETAVEWDAIERELREPELWAFITGRASGQPTHISVIFDTIAGGVAGRERPPYHTFEVVRREIDADPDHFWRKVVDLHSLIIGWSDDRNIFHKIGFLISERVKTLGQLVELADGTSKSAFQSTLDDLIRQHIDLGESDLRDLSYNSLKASRVLFLMNVETIRQRQHSTERYSFREHARGNWSLEHIHAQNAEELPARADVWEQWLRDHRRALEIVDEVPDGPKAALLARLQTVLSSPPVKGADFLALQRELTTMLSENDGLSSLDVDAISNLALLDGSDNSALSNSVFAVKRAAILERDRIGSYIPVCTRNVFLKYYTTDDGQHMHFWSATDRSSYLDAMVTTLMPYLKRQEADE